MVTLKTLVDRYELTDLIARGGMGSVYLAQDRRLGRQVAVKLLKDELAEDPRFIERFRREARASASISHGNIARVFDYGVDDHSHFIVMEYAPGRDLAHMLRDEGPLAPPRAREIAGQTAAALGCAHQDGLIHRDVKPGNILVDDQDHVKVTDFGIARAVGDATLTGTGSVLGTAQYLAPEQASGREVGPPTDVYATGIVLYEMLTGALPFTGGSAIEVAMRHVNDPVPAPSEIRNGIPPDLDEIVARATAKDPAHRFRDGDEMAAALAGDIPLTAPLPAGAHPNAEPREGDPWIPPRPARLAVLLFVVLIGLATALAAYRIAANDEGAGSANGRGDEADGRTEEPRPEDEAWFVVPSLSGMQVEEAEALIEAADVQVASERETIASEAPAGEVIGSAPPEGSRVESGGTITLIVSSGPADEADEDEDDDDDDDRPGKGKGRGKDKKGKDEDDD